MSSSAHCTITADGIQYNVELLGYPTIEISSEDMGGDSMYMLNTRDIQQSIKIEGIVGSIEEKNIRDLFLEEKKEKEMCRDRMNCDGGCAVNCDAPAENPYYGGHALVKKINDLSLSDDDRLLLKYNVIREDGTITETGKEVLLNILLNEHSERVIEALKDLDREEKKKK